MERANETLENLPDQIRDIVADEIKAALNGSAELFSAKLVEHNFANDTVDAKKQLQELQREREFLLADTKFADRELFEKVCKISLLDQLEMPPPPPSSLSSKAGLQQQPPSEFVCPITRELMEEPITLFTEIHQTYERDALEKFLHQYPCRDPITNVDSLEPLLYMRQINILNLGLNHGKVNTNLCYQNQQFQPIWMPPLQLVVLWQLLMVKHV